MPNFNVTGNQICKELNISREALRQRKNKHLKEKVDYIKITDRLILYTAGAIKKLKEKRK